MTETLTAAVAHERAEYTSQTDEDMPLGTYAALASAYSVGVGGFALVARRAGVRLPERIDARDLGLLAVGTYQLSKLVAKDRVTSFLRAPFVHYKAPGPGGDVEEEPRKHGVRKGVGDLLTCPFCTGQWVATALVCSHIAAPRLTRVVTSTLSALAGANFLQYADTLVNKRAQA